MEKIVETKTCRHCSTSFHITDKDLEFYEKVSPVFSCRDTICRDTINRVSTRKYPIPSPTLCPDCRQQRRLAFRNERKLYHRKCDLSGKQIISVFTPDKPHKVYDHELWWSDEWDPLDYGKNFDFGKSFFAQFDELLKSVPMMSLMVMKNENTPYMNFGTNNESCYMIFSSTKNYKSFFSSWTMDSEFIYDSGNILNSSLLYECVDCINVNNSYFCLNLKDCSDCIGCYDLIGCDNCIGCYNLRNKSYCINNKQFAKEEFQKIKSNIKVSHEILKNTISKAIHKSININNSENYIGDYITNSKNIYFCYDIESSQDCKYTTNALKLSDSQDVDYQAFDTSLCYQNLGVEESHNVILSFGTLGGINIYYSFLTFNCQNCFGCVGLKNKQYCIFNKQYTKEQYEKLVPKIIEHMSSPQPSPYGGEGVMEWGEFFPSSISPFGYNETVAQEYFPLSRDVSLKHLFKWSDYEKQNGYDGEFYIPVEISNYDEKKVGKEIAEKSKEDLLKGILKCEISGKPFRIISQELEFYIKHNLPIPTKHPDQRHLDRMKLRNPRKLFDRKCDKC